MNFTFLMCSERSGSNLITNIMDNHSAYCGPSPTHLFRILLENRDRYGDVSLDENWHMLLEDTLNLFETKLGVWLTHWNIEALDAAVPHRSIDQLLRIIYENEARAQGKCRLFIKENHIYRFFPFIQAKFSDAKMVYFVRDPRDMALSWKRSPNLRGCVIRAARTWQTDQQQGIRLFKDLSKQDQIILLKYEDLLVDPKRQLHRLCEFLEIEIEDQMAEFHKTGLVSENASRSADWRNLQKPLMRNNFNKYIDELSPEEIQYIEALCGVEMEWFGYSKEYEPVGNIEELESVISLFELKDKPAYQTLPQSEREMRMRRSNIVAKIKQRSILTEVDSYALQK